MAPTAFSARQELAHALQWRQRMSATQGIPRHDIPVHATLLDRLARLGLDVQQVLREASIPPSRFEAPKPRLRAREFVALWRVLESCGMPDVGLRLGAEAHQQNVAFAAALYARNLADGFQLLGRYQGLTCSQEITVDISGGEARVHVHWPLAEGSSTTALIDAHFAAVAAIAHRATVNRVAARRVELARRPANGPSLEHYFGCKIRFNASADVLVFDEKVLAEPFVTHSPDLLAIITPGLEAELARHRGNTSVVEDVRTALRKRISVERPSVAKVAKELALSSRSLQRRLEELGTSYQAVLGDVRRETALRLLESTDLDAGQVAFLLGFAELNSFTRAFRAWEGTTPSRWRALTRASTASQSNGSNGSRLAHSEESLSLSDERPARAAPSLVLE